MHSSMNTEHKCVVITHAQLAAFLQYFLVSIFAITALPNQNELHTGIEPSRCLPRQYPVILSG